MKKILSTCVLITCLSCINTNYNGKKNFKEEHIVAEVDERTDSLKKIFKPVMQNANSLRIIMKGYWNDTIQMMDSLFPKDKVDHNGIQPYNNGFPPGRFIFKKYKATKYHIRMEYIYSEEYFTSYKDNY
jgi:hypothetical protein